MYQRADRNRIRGRIRLSTSVLFIGMYYGIVCRRRRGTIANEYSRGSADPIRKNKNVNYAENVAGTTRRRIAG